MISFYVIVYAFLLYADALKFIPMINYWDEALTIAIPIAVLVRSILLRNFSMKRIETRMLVVLASVLGLGILGNIMSPGIQDETIAIVKDVLLYLKFPILMISLRSFTYSWTDYKKAQIVKKCSLVTKVSIVAAAAAAVVGYVVDIGVYSAAVRYVKCYRFVFRHPTFLVAFLVFCASMLILDDRKKNRYFIYVTCVLLFMTQRNKAYAIIGVILLIMLAKDKYISSFFSFNWRTKIRMKYVIPVLVVVGLIFYFVFKDKVETYLRWGMTSARIVLYVTSFKIAMDYFPFGSGLGTFASNLSGKYYSNIYTMYGIDKVDGLKADKYNYIADTFWPWVIGEFGFVAFILYGYIYYLFIKDQLNRIKSHNRILAFSVLWIYALLASAIEAFFSNTTCVTLAILLTVYVGVDKPYLLKGNGRSLQQ